MSSAGELHFSLREKVDRTGARYLFGGIRLFGVVMFVRVDPIDTKLFHAIVKPYEGGGANTVAADDFDAPWSGQGSKG